MTKLAEIVDRMNGRKIAVFGDVMLDEFVYGTSTRLSPEAPVPVVGYGYVDYRLGGCANASSNLAALGADVVVFGVRGEDENGGKLVKLLEASDIDSHIVVDPQRRTTTKTRVISNGHQIVRIDRESVSPISENFRDGILEKAESVIPSVDAVVLSDYSKGFLTDDLCKSLIRMSMSGKKYIIADPKGAFDKYCGVTSITPNFGEFKKFGLGNGEINLPYDAKTLKPYADAVMSKYDIAALLVTMEKHGMALFVGGDSYQVHALKNGRDVADTTGAGDTAIASYALALAAGADYVQAMRLANCAAGVVVQKIGTATCTRDELKKMLYFDRNPL